MNMNIIIVSIVTVLMGIFTQFVYNLIKDQDLMDDDRPSVRVLIYTTIFILSPVFFVGFIFITFKSLLSKKRKK